MDLHNHFGFVVFLNSRTDFTSPIPNQSSNNYLNMTSTTTQKPTSRVPQVFVNFATAGLGGVMGWVAIHPCNTVAIRMNLAMMSGNGAQLSFVNYLRTMIKEQGVSSLYNGLSAGITRQIFYATSRFGQSTEHPEETPPLIPMHLFTPVLPFLATFHHQTGLFEVLRDEMAKYRPTDIWSRLSVGVVSGGMAALISCPAEVTLVRMSNDSTLEVSKRRNYTGSWVGGLVFVWRTLACCRRGGGVDVESWRTRLAGGIGW
jgi:solute carrier family 25 oxoglutarate transporter 11